MHQNMVNLFLIFAIKQMKSFKEFGRSRYATWRNSSKPKIYYFRKSELYINKSDLITALTGLYVV